MKTKSIPQRTLAFFLSVMMFFSSFNIYVSAEDESTSDSTDYTDSSYNGVSGSEWEFDAYYINQDDKYYVEKNSDFNLKYQMEFHASRDLPANSVEIRIPAKLLTYRDDTDILPTEIAVPQGTESQFVESRVTSFNYYIDETTNDLVFFNYKQIDSGSNMTWQVLYKNLDAIKIIDNTSWKLEPTITVKIDEEITEERTAKALEGLVDTSVTLRSVSKEALKITGKSYGPELYTEGQVEEYISGDLPSWCSGDEFDSFVYIVWDVTATGNGNQPWNMGITDITGVSGNNADCYVVGYKNRYNASLLNNINDDKSSDYTIDIVKDSAKESFEVRFYIVCAYPKTSVTDGTILTNDIDITLTPVDGIDDTQTKSDSASWAYSNYNWEYSGNIIGITKNGGGTQKGMLDVYQNSGEKDSVKLSYKSVSSCQGYGFTHNIEGSNLGEYIKNTYYTVTTFDDILYTYPKGGSKDDMQMLDSKDYYFTNVAITQTDKGYDVWEDEYAAPEKVDTVDQSITIYAMYENSEEWQEVATVPWSDSGTMKYTFTSDDLAKKPWRVKVVHNSINYSTTCTINVEVCLRHDSPTVTKVIEDNPDMEELVIQNLSGVTGKTNDGEYFHNDGTENYEKYPDNLQEVSQELYDTLPMRDNAAAIITKLTTKAASYKNVNSSNDVTNGRVNSSYTITAYDGYEVGSQEVMEYLEEQNLQSPGRNAVVFYDLLPYGMKFDPSKPVNVGRITDLSKAVYQTQYKSWDKSNVTVTVKTEDNYNGTGRTLVAFHISYSGGDSSVYSNNMWFEGWGVNFSAYYEWKDIGIIQNSTNISAFMPEVGDLEPLLGSETQVSKDDGSKGGVYEDFGSDINKDEITEIYNVLYAENSTYIDVITSAESKIEKLVKADSDIFGVFKQETIVEYGSDYTYEITLCNTKGSLEDIVIYDKLEYAANDRSDTEGNMNFEENSWHGTFDSVVTKGLEQLGIVPVIYYNVNREASITTGSQQPSEVLTEENGWYRADEWTQLPSDVKAIAVDISKTTDDKDFILKEGESVSFQIKMTAPEVNDPQLTSETNYAYNNTSYYSYNSDTTTDATVISNSTRVSLNKKEILEVKKEFADENVPEQIKNNSFAFYLYQKSDWNDKKTTEKINFANKEYKLYVKDENGEWKQSNGLYATDANGMLTLHAGEKAVFEDLPDASSLIVEEEDNIFWESTVISPTTPTQDENNTDIYTHIVKNKYRPILYLQKQLKSVPSELDVSDYEFTFRIFANGEALANVEFWYVDEALTNGGIPNKIGTGTTDENGYVTIKAGEVIAVSPGDVGTEYKVIEVQSNIEEELWYCENEDNTVEGKVALNGSVATFTNIYRLKDLYITKEITHQDASKCTQEFTFKITDSEGTLMVGNEWVLLDSDGNETTTKGTLNENGEFTVACAGQTVKVEGFKANETYIVQETESGTLYKAVNGGIAEVTMPLYSLSANVTITNDYLKRPLSVSKTVMYNMEDTTEAEVVAEKEFTMTITVKGDIIGNYPYTVVDSYGQTTTGLKTDENGQFKIKNGETVTFEDIGTYGDSFIVTETEDDEYKQIYPANNAPHTGTLSQDENKVIFINGEGNRLIISKQYVGNDDISNQYVNSTKTDTDNVSDSSVDITLKYKDSDGSVKVWPATDTEVQVINGGDITEESWTANSTFNLSAWSMVVIPEGSIPSSTTYYVSESKENQHRIYKYNTTDSDGNEAACYLEISQKIPANDASVTGTIETNPVVTIVNEVKEIEITSEISKRMSIGSYDIPDGARLVWRVEKYVDGKWQPAENIGYIISDTNSDGTEVFSNGKLYTGSDGIIELEKREDCTWPTVKFVGANVNINVQEPDEGQYRVIELYDESDEIWGMLAGYGNADDLSISTSLDSEKAVAFVNSNVNTPLEIEKVMEIDCDETFAMTLKQVISSSDTINSNEDIVESVIRSNVPYTVYDSETDEQVSEGLTDQYGNIYLKAGQFVRIELPDSTVWTVSEEINPRYTLKEMSGTPEGDERLTELNANLMLISMQYEFETEDISITAEMVASGVYDSTGKKITLNTGDVKIPEYIIYNNQRYRVTGIAASAFNGNTAITSIELPDTLKTIGDKAFYGCTGLSNVTIPDSVQSIGTSAFFDCKSLTDITIGNGVTSIGNSAFQNCLSLNDIIIPSNVRSLGNNAFQDCGSLKTVIINNGLTSIGQYTFTNCGQLTEITIPNSVTSIGAHVFNGCSSLSSINIPDTVTSIGNNAFNSCSSLSSITIPSGVTSIQNSTFNACGNLTSVTIQGNITSIGTYAFNGCTKLSSINIPDTVTSIGSYAFQNCTDLSSITIPSGVTSIGERTFKGCTGLSSITIPSGVKSIGIYAFQNCTGLSSITIADTVKSIGTSAFQGCTSLISIIIPSSVTAISNSVFSGCTGLSNVTIPDSVTTINISAFNGCSSLSSITIPSGVTSIGSSAFKGCSSLSNVTIPSGVTSIESSTFDSCSNLTSVTIQGNVTSIGSYAFNDCTKLSSINIPDTVTSIGSYAFNGCENLSSITIPSGVTSIGAHGFDGCSSLSSITIPSSVTSIGNYVFDGCTSLTSIEVDTNNENYSSLNGVLFNKNQTTLISYPAGKTGEYEIPNTVTTIQDYAFKGRENITSITIPNSVISIGTYAFYNCTGLTSIIVSDGIVSIGTHAFHGCSNLSSITIPNTVTSIGEYAFHSCSSLTSITIPDSVTSIPRYGFHSCSKLSSVTLPNTITSVEVYAFAHCTSLKSITIPSSVTSIGNYAFYGCTGTTITVEKTQNSITGSPWGATNATVSWTG